MVKPPFCITNYKQQRNYYYLDNTLTGSGPIADGNLPKKNTTTMQHMLQALAWCRAADYFVAHTDKSNAGRMQPLTRIDAC